MKQLENKIEHEYKIFKLSYIATSRENIFTHADEISMKVQIYQYLKRNLKKLATNEPELLAIDNIIDNVYGQMMECQQIKPVLQLERWLQKQCGGQR